MAGGTGKYNERLLESLARNAVADIAPLAETPMGHTGLTPSRRHCWALGPPEDPGPHPALLTGPWQRRDARVVRIDDLVLRD